MLPVPEPIHTRQTAVILTALALETSSVLRHLSAYSTETVLGTYFFRGHFEDWDVAVAEVGAGNVGSAAIAARACDHFQPKIALFVGVAGGVKDVAIGDVVVATKVYGYESGKDKATGFQGRPDLLVSAHAIEQRARNMCQVEDWRARLDPQFAPRNPNLIVGPIAAGEKVVASTRTSTAKLLRKLYSDALAVEMEGRGFLEGVHINHSVQGGVIRGISDLLSGKAAADRSGSQRKAADAAAAVAFHMLSGIAPLTASPSTSKSSQHREVSQTNPDRAQPAKEPKSSGSRMRQRRNPRYYVSYAWSDRSPTGRDREVNVDRLCVEAEKRGTPIIRDKNTLGVGDSISKYMRKLGQGDRIYIFLSDKYLKSRFCMSELFAIWNHSRRDEKDFLNRCRVFRLGDADIWTDQGRLSYATHWKTEADQTKVRIENSGISGAATADFAQFKLMQEFALRVGDILWLFADKVQASNFDEFLQYGFDDPPISPVAFGPGNDIDKRPHPENESSSIGPDGAHKEQDEDEKAHISEVKTRIANLLSKSVAAVDWLRSNLEMPSDPIGLDGRCAALAEKLTCELQLKPAIESLHKAYKAFSDSDAGAAMVLQQVTLEIVQLLYRGKEIEPLRNLRPHGGGIFFKLRAAKETAAEIAMAAADRRRPRFKEADHWPIGHNALPTLPVTGPEDSVDAIAATFIELFEKDVLPRVLRSDELKNFTADQRLESANNRLLEQREEEGTLYLAFHLPTGKIESDILEEIIKEHLGPRWPSIVFLNLSHDRGQVKQEEDMLWAIRRLLLNNAGAAK